MIASQQRSTTNVVIEKVPNGLSSVANGVTNPASIKSLVLLHNIAKIKKITKPIS